MARVREYIPPSPSTMSNDTDESDINPHTPKRLRPGSNGGKGSAIVPSASSRLSPPPQKRDDFSPAPEDDSVDPVSPPPKSRSDMGPPPKPNKKAEVTSAPSREALEADASKSKPKSKLEPPEKEMEKNSSGNGKRKGMRMGKAKEKVKQQDFYHIGGSDIVPRRVGLNDFKGSKTVSIREWYEDKATGEMKPGRSVSASNLASWLRG